MLISVLNINYVLMKSSDLYLKEWGTSIKANPYRPDFKAKTLYPQKRRVKIITNYEG